MTKETFFTLLMESFILYWWGCMAYSRHKTALAKEEERKKYAAWDNAFNAAIKAEKTHYQATLEAVRAVGAGQPVLNLWNETYKKATAAGMREYRAKMEACAAAREAAHRQR